MLNDETVLIKECKKGNRQAFETLVKKYYLPLTRFFYRHVHNTDISEELTHETVIKLIEKIDRYRVIPGAKFSSWLYRIAYNTYVDYVRKKPPVVTELDEAIDIARTDEDLQETVIKKLTVEQLNRMLDAMPAEMKSMIILRYYNGFSYKEIGKVMRIDQGKVKSRLHYAVSRLRRACEADRRERHEG